MRFEAVDASQRLGALAAVLDSFGQGIPPFREYLLPIGGAVETVAPRDQLLGRKARELRTQRLVVGGELGAVALGGFGDMRNAITQVGRDGAISSRWTWTSGVA